MENQPKATDFKPSAEQLVFADAYIQAHGSIREAFQTIGRDRSIYYSNWRHQVGFEEWLSVYCKDQVMRRRGHWYLWLEKYARAGSAKHLQMLLEIAKELEHAPNSVINVYPNKTFVFRDLKEEKLGIVSAQNSNSN